MVGKRMADVRTLGLALVLCLLAGWSISAENVVEVGGVAPDFELKDARGTAYNLSAFRGKQNVVLEFIRSGSW